MQTDIVKQKTSLVEEISFGEKFAYGLGDLASNLALALTASLITYFYTNVIGIAAATAGTIMLVSRIFDGVTDVLMGILVDKTHSKYGKARPWILWMAFPLGISTIMLVTVPNISITGKIIYAFITYNLATTVFYTAINIPYGALNSFMTRDQYQRSVINIFRMSMAMIGSAVITSITLPIINSFGGKQDAWIKVTSFYAIIAVILFLVCFKRTKERVTRDTTHSNDNIKVKESVKALLKNKYWLIIVLIWLVMALGMSFSGTISIYYAQYVLGNSSYMGLIAAAGAIPTIVIIPFMAPFIKRFGKRNLALGGSFIAMVGALCMLIAPHSLSMIIAASVIKGIGMAPLAATIFAMVADTIEYGEWRTRVRVQGLLYSATTFGAKVGAGVGGGLAGYILSVAGYNGMIASQPNSAIKAIIIMFLVVPILFAVIQAICFWFYKLDKEYPQIMLDLQERAAKRV